MSTETTSFSAPIGGRLSNAEQERVPELPESMQVSIRSVVRIGS